MIGELETRWVFLPLELGPLVIQGDDRRIRIHSACTCKAIDMVCIVGIVWVRRRSSATSVSRDRRLCSITMYVRQQAIVEISADATYPTTPTNPHNPYNTYNIYYLKGGGDVPRRFVHA